MKASTADPARDRILVVDDEPDMAESCASCLTFEPRPETPHNIRKYRKTFFSDPGQRVLPAGQIDDNLAQKLQAEGKRFAIILNAVFGIIVKNITRAIMSANGLRILIDFKESVKNRIARFLKIL